MDEPKPTHLDEQGRASMVDISAKPPLRRTAVARGRIRLARSSVQAIAEGGAPKGDVLAVARIAGIQAAKQCQNLIPLCHQIPLSKATVEFEIEEDGVVVEATCRTTAPTGVEMEALTAVSIAALTIYDMLKAIDDGMVVEQVRLVSKTREDPGA